MARAILPEIPKKAKVVKGDIVVAKDLTFHGATYVDGNVSRPARLASSTAPPKSMTMRSSTPRA